MTGAAEPGRHEQCQAKKRCASSGPLHTNRALGPQIDNPNYGAPGSMPFVLITATASGVRRNSINCLETSGYLAPVMMAAEKTMFIWRSLGNGTTTSIPATGISS